MEVVATLLSVPAVIAVVNFLKQYGLSNKVAPFVSVLVGAIFGLAASYIQYQGFNISPFLMGVVTGFSASGIYDITKTTGASNVSVDSASTVNVNQPTEVNTPITGTTPICNTPEIPAETPPQVIQNQPEITPVASEAEPIDTPEMQSGGVITDISDDDIEPVGLTSGEYIFGGIPVARWGYDDDGEEIVPKG